MLSLEIIKTLPWKISAHTERAGREAQKAKLPQNRGVRAVGYPRINQHEQTTE